MFIVSTKDNKYYNEGADINGKALTWDDIPKDVKISGIQLLYPFPIQFRDKEGKVLKETKPKFSLSGYDEYYFYNESTVPLLVSGASIVNTGKTILEAKIVGGIDKTTKMVTEYRMDKWGNLSINRLPLSDLEDRIKDQIFRGDIVRKGS